MYKTPSTDTGPHRHSWLLYSMLVIGFVCLFILGIGINTTTSYAAGRPGGNVTDPVVRAVDIAEPAVVRIFTTVGGHLTVHFSNGNNVTFPQGTGSYQLLLSGSGTFISAHGDILTADHVINPPHDSSLHGYLDDKAANDVAAYINQNSKPGSSQATPDQVDQALKSGDLRSDANYDPATSDVYLSTAYTGPLGAADFNSIPGDIHASVDRIEKESSFSDKDVAIVHVPMNDTPSVQLGDSTSVQQQDELTIIGFPGNGDVSSRPTDILTPSVNKTIVSSIKTTDTGAQVIQVGGNVEHGDSGGPALDSNGTVVGIVSFGLVSSDSPGGTSFLQASNSARDLVQSLNLDTTPGTFQKAWSQAFTDYAADTPGHWHKAQQEFGKLATNYPLFKAVTPYLTYTQDQAKNEQLPKSSPPPAPKPSPFSTLLAYVWTFVAILIVLLLVAVLFSVITRRRRKKSGAGGNAGKPAMAQASQGPLPSTIAQQRSNPTAVAAQREQPPTEEDGMAAFGAPSKTTLSIPVPPTKSGPPSSNVSGTLRPWPCGHMNRPNARFCSICGEPAPPPITRRVDQ